MHYHKLVKPRPICNSEFQQNFIVIKVKGNDLNDYQSKKRWQHCCKDVMQSSNINFFKRKLQ
jgi:hypothetical protein